MQLRIEPVSRNKAKIRVVGRLDTNTVAEFEQAFQQAYEPEKSYEFDLESLEYISSVGLRFFLKLHKSHCEFELINVSAEVYDILQMTGFTELLTVRRAYRQVDVTGCRVIGAGMNGRVYRLDEETVIKVYLHPDCMDDIISEKEHARFAFLKGIPTAIAFDIVKAGDKFGAIFELVDAKSMNDLLAEGKKSIGEITSVYNGLLKTVHAIRYGEGDALPLPRAKALCADWVEQIAGVLPEETGAALARFAASLPEGDSMLHGDAQPNNVMLTGDGPLFIDMDTMMVGDPVFEFGALYTSLSGFGEAAPEQDKLHFDQKIVKPLWEAMVMDYCADRTDAERALFAAQAKLIAAIKVCRKIAKRVKKDENASLDSARAYLMHALAAWKKAC